MVMRVTPPRQTQFGSTLYYKDPQSGKQKHQEFATEDEAISFAFALSEEERKYDENAKVSM